MKRGTNTKSVIMYEDEVQRRLSALGPKRQFMDAAVNMGWQLAGAVLIPVIIGVKLDDHFHTTPSYTLAALVLACCGAIAVVSSMIKKVNAQQNDDKLATPIVKGKKNV